MSLSPENIEACSLLNVSIAAVPASTTIVLSTRPTSRGISTKNVLPTWTKTPSFTAV